LAPFTRECERESLVTSFYPCRRMDGVQAYVLEDLGLRQLRGREAAVRVYAVARA
jgi:hypothetical protein